MTVLNKVKELLKKADAKLSDFNIYTMQPNETMKDARRKAQEQNKTKLFFITAFTPDITYDQVKYINSLSDVEYEALRENKTLIQMLYDYEKTKGKI